MLDEMVIDSIRRFESIGYTERFETAQGGLRSQQTGVLHPADGLEAEHVVALGRASPATGDALLFALRSRVDGAKGTWVVARDAGLPRDAERLVQRLAGANPKRTWTSRLPLGPARAGDHVLDGLQVGVGGASLLALWFLLVDSWLREPLFTPSLVGNRLFGRGVDAHELTIDLGSVALVVVLHGLLFALFGIATAWFVGRHVERPRFPGLFLGVFVALEAGFVLGSELLIPGAASTIGHGFILVGNAVAAAGMAFYLRWLQPHPADPRKAFARGEAASRVARTTRRAR